jgi:hypothetical protein
MIMTTTVYLKDDPFDSHLLAVDNTASSNRTVRRELVAHINNCIIRIPVGFTTDGASIPSFLWSIYPPWGRYSRAAVAHDFLYSPGCVIIKNGDAYKPTRAFADLTLRHLMQKLNCRPQTPWVFWIFVRAFGWLHWNKPK